MGQRILEPHVGDLISMPAPRRATIPTEQGRSAAILFFTGVRYYRMDDEHAVTVPTKQARKARKGKAVPHPCPVPAMA